MEKHEITRENAVDAFIDVLKKLGNLEPKIEKIKIAYEWQNSRFQADGRLCYWEAGTLLAFEDNGIRFVFDNEESAWFDNDLKVKATEMVFDEEEEKEYSLRREIKKEGSVEFEIVKATIETLGEQIKEREKASDLDKFRQSQAGKSIKEMASGGKNEVKKF